MHFISMRTTRFFVCLVYIASLVVPIAHCDPVAEMTPNQMEEIIADLPAADAQKVRDLWGFIEEKRREGTPSTDLAQMRADLIASIRTVSEERKPQIGSLAKWTAGLGVVGGIGWRFFLTEIFRARVPFVSFSYLAPLALATTAGVMLIHKGMQLAANRRLASSIEGLQGRFAAAYPGTYQARSSWSLGFGDAWTPQRQPEPAPSRAPSPSPSPASQPGPEASQDDPWAGHNRSE